METSASSPTLSTRRSLPDIIGLGGAVAGFLAGLVMILLSPILAFLTGIGIWEPPKMIAATLLGPAAMEQPGFALVPVVTGAAIHMVTSIVLGAVFGIIFHRMLHLTTDFGLPLYAGLGYGMITFLIAYFIVLPLVNPLLTESSMLPLITQNVAFGLCLGIFYVMLRPQMYRE